MKVMVAAIAALALFAGCGGGGNDSSEEQPAAEATPNIVQPGAPGEPSRKLTPEEAAKTSRSSRPRPTSSSCRA